MNKLRWERAQRAIGSLSGTRKILAGTLIAGMIAAGAWIITHPARSAMEPVLDQAFNDADLVQIADHLTAKNIPHEIRQGKMLVPADRKLDALSSLLYAQIVTGSTETGFDALILKQGSIFDSPSKTDKMFNHARELMVASVISRWPGVRKTTVLIDPTSERHIGSSIEPSALVDIQTRAGEVQNRRKLADGAVNAVIGAISSMSREKVKVTIDGASYNVAGDDEIVTLGGDVIERRQECEQAYVSKVRNLLSYIPDVLVSVSVDLNLQSHEEEKRLIDPDNSVHLETRVESRKEQPLDSALDQEIGVLANAVPELGEKPASTPKSDTTTTEYFNRASETVQKTRTPAGKETVLSASVAVPRSYFVALYQRSVSKPQPAPDNALVQPIVDSHLARIRSLVRTSLGLKNDSDVTVDVYDDAAALTPVAASNVTAQATVVPQMLDLAKHGQSIGYAAAGVAGVIVMSLVLRRGNHHTDPASAVVHATVQPLAASRTQRVAAAPVPRSVAVDQDNSDSDLLRQVRELAARSPDDTVRVLREWIFQD